MQKAQTKTPLMSPVRPLRNKIWIKFLKLITLIILNVSVFREIPPANNYLFKRSEFIIL